MWVWLFKFCDLQILNRKKREWAILIKIFLEAIAGCDILYCKAISELLIKISALIQRNLLRASLGFKMIHVSW